MITSLYIAFLAWEGGASIYRTCRIENPTIPHREHDATIYIYIYIEREIQERGGEREDREKSSEKKKHKGNKKQAGKI